MKLYAVGFTKDLGISVAEYYENVRDCKN